MCTHRAQWSTCNVRGHCARWRKLAWLVSTLNPKVWCSCNTIWVQHSYQTLFLIVSVCWRWQTRFILIKKLNKIQAFNSWLALVYNAKILHPAFTCTIYILLLLLFVCLFVLIHIQSCLVILPSSTLQSSSPNSELGLKATRASLQEKAPNPHSNMHLSLLQPLPS